MHRIDAGASAVLLDCGLHQGNRSVSRERNETFPFRPRKIDAVLLSHAHIDHCGNLPNFVRQGFQGTIYCTAATRALAGVMLGDAAKIQQEDTEYLNRHRAPGEPQLEPLYTERDVYRTLLKMRAVEYDVPMEVTPSVEATFVEAGHVLGSAMIQVRIKHNGGDVRVTYTGDLGRPNLPILRSPAPIPPADLIISESTYGGQQHETVEETAEQLGEVVLRTAERGGKVIIPAFSVGRTQTVVYFLHQLINAGRLPRLPIYVDSPMSVRATEVFRAHPECFDEPTRRLLEEHPELFGEGWVTYIDKVHESIELNRQAGPSIIISASGMCEAGRVLHHLRHNISDPRSTILIVGYQAEGTLGRRIAERQPELRILGRKVPLRAEVVTLSGLSSHADHQGLMAALAPLAESTRAIRLVHGEASRAQQLADALRQVGFRDVAIPQRGDVHQLAAP